jgi:hypothetical protein
VVNTLAHYIAELIITIKCFTRSYASAALGKKTTKGIKNINKLVDASEIDNLE